ncbi:hypothetical protein QR680_015799 [Steinernema hermaphroditum]|uniref:Uncharacterized protein n=1 Tax=Steinernema hermaphroditum TaxID=289476 RepID=A0AA39LLC8_9BILA|nr:hypothetical protein QR680_015799 [Steinernema hermaphroditum]
MRALLFFMLFIVALAVSEPFSVDLRSTFETEIGNPNIGEWKTFVKSAAEKRRVNLFGRFENKKDASLRLFPFRFLSR